MASIQGHVEGSNVNPVLEMAKLMTISRAIESISNASQASQKPLNDALKTLGDVDDLEPSPAVSA